MSYAKLRGRILEKFKTIRAFSEAMGMDVSSISAKLNNKRSWKREEIEKACLLLEIPFNQIHEYFFTPKIAKPQS